jgi:hypothetical protein
MTIDAKPFPLPARPTIYRGIKMRSRLEAEYAAALDTWPDTTWRYEPVCFASPQGQYLPDFAIDLKDGSHIYIEVKPVVVDPPAILRRMEIVWASEPGAGLMLTEQRGERRLWTAMFGIWEMEYEVS